MTDYAVPTATEQLRRDIVASLDLEAFDPGAYHDRAYLTAALEAGFDVVELATAHGVSKKSLYRALDTPYSAPL
jgi:hypothetical protein